MLIPNEHEFITAFGSNNLPFLGPTRVEQLKQFLHAIRSCDSETARYELCLEKRDELLERQDQLLGERVRLHIEFAFYEPAFAESTTYKAASQKDRTWQKFANGAEFGRNSQTSRWTAELKSAATGWGEEIVQHYAGERGVNFAVEFARVARTHPSWETNALPRFQQLVRRRIQLIEKHGRHSFRNPLERIDLVNARLWDTNNSYIKHKDPDQVYLPVSILREEELPCGYGFDQYGLLVPKAPALDEAHQSTDSHAAADPIRDTDPTAYQSASAASEEDPSTRKADAVATDNAFSSIMDCAPDTSWSSSRVLETISCSNQLVDGSTREPRGSISGAEPITASGGSGPGRLPNYRPSSGGVPNIGSECQSPHSSGPIILRRSARTLVKNSMVQDVGRVSAKASSQPRACGRKYGSRTQRPVEKEAQHVTAVRMSKTLHVDQLKTLAGMLPAVSSTKTVDSSAKTSSRSKRDRAASLPPATLQDYDSKRHRIDNLGLGTDIAPIHHIQTFPMSGNRSDDAFLALAKMELTNTAGESSNSRGVQTALHLLPILQNCKHPITDNKEAPIELYRLSGQLAKELLSIRTPDVPIVTEQQQHFKWKDPTQPLAEFFDWMEDLDRMVSVQIPSLAVDRNSCERRSLRQVQKRLLSYDSSKDPWNVLDCSCPLPSTLPDFLTSWNCQLLGRIRETVLNVDGAERAMASREDWTHWRDIENWALLSEGGHCTAPHIDSHGLATWITVQEGAFGFIWLSRPTDEQHTRWMEDPEHYDEGQQWRFLVLQPGQTILIPSGTIHSVFRVQDTKTLALGGHILQWTGVDQWAETISKQALNPDSTNEDMSDVWKWIPVVESLLRKRLQRSERAVD